MPSAGHGPATTPFQWTKQIASHYGGTTNAFARGFHRGKVRGSPAACETQPRTMRPASRLHTRSYSERNLPALINPRGGTRRMLLKRTSVAILIAVAASGCTQMRRDRYCKYALPAWGAALGGAGAGLGVSQGSDHASAPEIGGAGAGGARLPDRAGHQAVPDHDQRLRQGPAGRLERDQGGTLGEPPRRDSGGVSAGARGERRQAALRAARPGRRPGQLDGSTFLASVSM